MASPWCSPPNVCGKTTCRAVTTSVPSPTTNPFPHDVPPMPRLKKAQRWLLDEILSKVKAHPAAHGFTKDRNIVSNASPHVGARVVVNLDLSDFFPTLGYRRVRGMFRKLGYSEQAATIFALLATEPDTAQVELDGQRYHVALGERRLPQGAPTSSAVTNAI